MSRESQKIRANAERKAAIALGNNDPEGAAKLLQDAANEILSIFPHAVTDPSTLLARAAEIMDAAGRLRAAGNLWREAGKLLSSQPLRRDSAAAFLHRASQSYRACGDFEDADEAIASSRRSRRQYTRQVAKTGCHRWWKGYVMEGFFEITSNYGTSLWRLLAFILAGVACSTVAGFALSCCDRDMFKGSPTASQQFVDPSWPARMFDIAYFSVVTMTTLGFGDIVPGSRLGQSYTIVIVAFGYLSLAILAAVLVERFQRK